MALMTLLFNPTIPALGCAMLYIWLHIRIERDPQWRSRPGRLPIAPVVVPTHH